MDRYDSESRIFWFSLFCLRQARQPRKQRQTRSNKHPDDQLCTSVRQFSRILRMPCVFGSCEWVAGSSPEISRFASVATRCICYGICRRKKSTIFPACREPIFARFAAKCFIFPRYAAKRDKDFPRVTQFRTLHELFAREKLCLAAKNLPGDHFSHVTRQKASRQVFGREKFV